MYKKILIPVDGSQVAGHAASEGFKLARVLGSEVVLLYVVDISLVTIPEAESGIANVEMVSRGFRSHGEAILKKLEADAKAAGLEVTSIIRQGDVDDEIVSVADEVGSGLVILGTHGRRGFRKLLLGSVADAVSKRAHCPVLLVRPEE